MYWNRNSPGLIALSLLLVLMGALKGFAQVPREHLFPYGPSNEDTALGTCTHCHSGPITLKSPFKFFNTTYTELYVYAIGLITNRTGITKLAPRCDSTISRNSYGALIAPFWSFVATHFGGQVYCRESMDTDLVSKAEVEVRRGFPAVGKSLFLKSVFIATWDDVTTYDDSPCPNRKLKNTLQAILTTDGVKSFVIFYYSQLQWSTSNWYRNRKCVPWEDHPASAGITAGRGHPFHDVLGNCSEPFLQLVEESNIGEPGKWVFRVDKDFQRPSDPTFDDMSESDSSATGISLLGFPRNMLIVYLSTVIATVIMRS